MKTLIILAVGMMTSLALNAECRPGAIAESRAVEKALDDVIKNRGAVLNNRSFGLNILPVNYCFEESDGSAYTISVRIQRHYTYKAEIKRRLWGYKMVSNESCTDFDIVKVEMRPGDALPSGCNGLYHNSTDFAESVN